MSYSYSTGNGVAVLLPTEPAGTEPYLNLAPAIRQIKAYLNDTSVGPEKKAQLVSDALAALTASLSSSGTVPVGTTMFYSAEAAPAGWLVCNGQEVDRNTYSALFNVIGVIYGNGNGVNTFNLPDSKGRVIAGADAGRGLMRTVPEDVTKPFTTLGSKYGTRTVALVEDTMPSHFHTVPGADSPPFLRAVTNGSINPAGNPGTMSNTFRYVPATASSGNSTPHNNEQPTFCLPLIIKYQ